MRVSILQVCFQLATASVLITMGMRLQAQPTDVSTVAETQDSVLSISATAIQQLEVQAFPNAAMPANQALKSGIAPVAQELPEVIPATPVYDPNAAGICPAVTGFLQDYCGQYPDDPGCKF